MNKKVSDKEIASNNLLQEWVSAYADDLYRWALHKVNDKETAQDLVQESFLAAIKSIRKFKGNSQPKTWLFAIMNNKIIDYHRKRFKSATINVSNLNSSLDGGDVLDNFFDSEGTWKASARPTAWHELEEHLLDNPQFKQVLNNCFKNLPHKWDSVVRFKYLEEKKAKEICQELGISPTNYWQILHRAKLQLRTCLEKNWIKE